MNLAGQKVDDRRRAALVGNVHHIDSGHHLEHLSSDMIRCARSGRSVIDFAGIGFGISDQIIDRFGWE